MENIPDDIRNTVWAADRSTDLAIMSLILAERERCAKIVEDGQEVTRNSSAGTLHIIMPRTPGNIAGLAYAEAIRAITATPPKTPKTDSTAS